MNKITRSIKDLRKDQYTYNTEHFPFLNDWKSNPYTFLKSRFYMELSALLVYFLLKTKIKPNFITILYGLAGILGGVFLAVSTNITHLIAIIIFFTKGILDWSDGHLARVRGQTSITGHILDIYGAFLNDIALQIGLGFYVVSKTGIHFFYYLIPLIPFFYATKLTSFSAAVFFNELAKKDFLRMLEKEKLYESSVIKITENMKKEVSGKKKRYYEYFASFLDARARNVDFICLLILIEMLTNFSITWIVFIAFVLKGFVVFVGSYYVILKEGWIKKEFNAALNSMEGIFDKTKK